jgi:hypothetical protein
MTSYGEALDQLEADAAAMAKWTRDRLEFRSQVGRYLAVRSREQLVATAAALEATAADLRAMASAEAADPCPHRSASPENRRMTDGTSTLIGEVRELILWQLSVSQFLADPKLWQAARQDADLRAKLAVLTDAHRRVHEILADLADAPGAAA